MIAGDVHEHNNVFFTISKVPRLWSADCALYPIQVHAASPLTSAGKTFPVPSQSATSDWPLGAVLCRCPFDADPRW